MIDKLVLAYQDEILNAILLNTTNTISINDKNISLFPLIY